MSKLAHSNQATMDEIEARRCLMDNEATEFAMHILMPSSFLRREIESMGDIDVEDFHKVKLLAGKFRVSEQIMALRLGNLMKEPKA